MIGGVSLISWVLIPIINSIDKIPALVPYEKWWDWAKFDDKWWLPFSVFALIAISYLIWAPYKYYCELEESSKERESNLKDEIKEMRRLHLAQADRVLLTAAPMLGASTNPEIVATLLDSGIGELESNESVLVVIDHINQGNPNDWLWKEIMEYIPRDKMLPFFRQLAMSPINRHDPWKLAFLWRELLPKLCYPNIPRLPPPPPTAPPIAYLV